MEKGVWLKVQRQDAQQNISGERAFHIANEVRRKYQFDEALYELSGNVIFADVQAVRNFCIKVNLSKEKSEAWQAHEVNAMALIDEINHYLVRLYREKHDGKMWSNFFSQIDLSYGKNKRKKMIELFGALFSPRDVYQEKVTLAHYLSDPQASENRWEVEMEESWMLFLANNNPAFAPYGELFVDEPLRSQSIYIPAIATLRHYLQSGFAFGPEGETLFELLEKPAKLFPHSLQQQLEYMQRYWAKHFHLEAIFAHKLVKSLLLIKEQGFAPKYAFGADGHGDGRREVHLPRYRLSAHEPEAFTDDHAWMPNVVMIAKNALVWLGQLSKKYGYPIEHLNDIPNEELIHLAQSGINTLWLIGIWQRSYASKRIKQIMGNIEAAASAYSLEDNVIAPELGGWQALVELRERAHQFGVQLASDMVPNHTGMDSRWVAEHPDYFLQRRDLPYDYHFTGENLTQRHGIELYLEDGYYRKSDAAVVFKRVDSHSGEVRYIYHGNDGTMMPWNDTAQIDFLNPQAREAVIQEILKMAHNFSVIRLDAAMVLVKKHIQRLWYPSIHHGAGDYIASRGEYAMSDEEFERLMPVEFWREVVDRVAKERPQTLLIAEAFWMLEGYFVRSLGMHRVYNSAFMHMLMQEDNAEYRAFIKKTITFDLGILKRFVNFMSNPDEKTAVEQFGRGDKYIGVATLMSTLPGLPMFAHGQLEGFSEKYGMEYTRAYYDEEVDEGLLARHRSDIFPLLHRRGLFSQSRHFRLYDFMHEGAVEESVFAYSNAMGDDVGLVVYNNRFPAVQGNVHWSCSYKNEHKQLVSQSIADALHLHDADGYYVIFQEQRSGLWYIRSSVSVHREGFHILLRGYESQVFWNIREVTDPYGHYYHLCQRLHGAGSRYDLLSTHPTSFALESEIIGLTHQLTPMIEQSMVGFYPLGEDQVVKSAPLSDKELQALDLKQERLYLTRIAKIVESNGEDASLVGDAYWTKVQQEYRYLLQMEKFITKTAKDSYLLDERYLRFVHYYFWLKTLYDVGVSSDILENEVVRESLRSWWQESSWESFSQMHHLALGLVQNHRAMILTREELDDWWQELCNNRHFMQSVGVNSYDDVLYFHDESLNLALHLIWSVLYFEQNMTGKLYGYRSKLNLIQQAKRWQSKREQSHYLYVEFTQAIGR